MKRTWMGVLGAATLAIGAAACSSNSFDSVAVTTNPSAVAGCEKVADVAAKPGRFDDSTAETQLTRAALAKGGNTLLVASKTAETGTAYRCSMPSAAANSKPTDSGSH